jgi:uncharacterized protein
VTEGNRLTNAANEMATARDALRVAHAALELGIVRDALSRAYYAVFHAVRALLLLDGIEPKTHAGVGSLFSERWIRTKRLESSHMLVFTRLQAYRAASDYAYAFDIEVEDARVEVQSAEQFVARVVELVDQATNAGTRE